MSINIAVKRIWLSNFESLCPYLHLNVDFAVKSLIEYFENQQLKVRCEESEIWKTEKRIFGYSPLTEIIIYCQEEFFKQPVLYLEALKQVPELITDQNVEQRFKFLYEEIEHKIAITNRFKQKILDDIQEKIKFNKAGTEEFLFKILLIYENNLDNGWGYSSQDYHFNFFDSPVFIAFYEMINKIYGRYHNLNSNSRFQQIEEFYQSIPEKKAKFDLFFIENNIDSFYNQHKKNAPTIPRLQTSLTTYQRTKLFTELVNGGFIPDEKKDCFNWAIAVTDEKETEQPGQWQPIKWNKKKDAFWMLFELILGTISNEHKRRMKILFLDEDYEPMDKLRKPKPNDKSKQETEIKDILRKIGIITEQPFKHKPIR